jgi:hypothetical protein
MDTINLINHLIKKSLFLWTCFIQNYFMNGFFREQFSEKQFSVKLVVLQNKSFGNLNRGFPS